MFKTIGIPNRGEILCRIGRTCKEMGIRTVALCSERDVDSFAANMADQVCCIGPAPPQESYLNIPQIIAVAKKAGVEAIHPGYGFLSESHTFARCCKEAGIRFIGPSAEVMEEMGDKLRARKLAKKVGLAVLQGTDVAVQDNQVEELAGKLGFPLMVKAAEGGGGIGIHVIESMEQLMPLVKRTQQAARSAFGSPRVFFERYLKGASHIEVQLIGDEHGNLIHLGERDCSIQRRNQKLIEETPAVKLTHEMRQDVCNMALRLAEHIGYTNAGTVEFLVSPEGQIYFLEVNTRLQVEHGITEMVTGLDLVELQIRVAAGESLGLTQKDVRPRGYAIEARVYPEDPATLIPQCGTITGLRLPSSDGTRVDSALVEGYVVTEHYEPLLAKVMAWAETRQESIERVLRALEEFRVEGVPSNTPLLREALASKEFTSATHHTGFLAALMGRRRAGSNSNMYPIQTNNQTFNPWRSFGREEQFRRRTGTNCDWRGAPL